MSVLKTPKGGEGMTPQLNRVIRLDSLPLGQTCFTEEGYLLDRPILTSTGIFEYRNPDGSIRRELRLPEDVFAPESLASYKGKPIIITHDAGLVNSKNVHEEGIGTILTEGYRSGDDVRAEIVIHDTKRMKECRLKELSLGYNLTLEETPGEWNGEHYDAIQRDIQINHLALVREARAGEQARLNIDGRDHEKTLKGGKAMSKTPTKTRRSDGILSQEELAKAIEEYKQRRAANAPEQADEAPVTETPVVEEKQGEVPAVVEDEAPAAVNGETNELPIEDQVAEMKERRAEDSDDDMKKLFDIIDTLLAQKDFDAAEEVKPEEEEVIAVNSDEDEETETNEDEGDETEEKPEENVDGEACEDKNCDEDDTEGTEENTDECDKTMNADGIEDIIRQRIAIGTIGRSLNLDGLEYKKIPEAKRAIISAVRPNIRLDGKGEAYINAMFDLAVDELNFEQKKGTDYQKRQMFNKDSGEAKRTCESSMDARARMIERQQNKNTHKEEK